MILQTVSVQLYCSHIMYHTTTQKTPCQFLSEGRLHVCREMSVLVEYSPIAGIVHCLLWLTEQQCVRTQVLYCVYTSTVLCAACAHGAMQCRQNGTWMCELDNTQKSISVCGRRRGVSRGDLRVRRYDKVLCCCCNQTVAQVTHPPIRASGFASY